MVAFSVSRIFWCQTAFLVVSIILSQTLSAEQIQIKLYQVENITTTILIESQPNSQITFSKEQSNINRIVLVCSSEKEPVVWEYFVSGKNWTALLETSYRRIITLAPSQNNSEDSETEIFQTNVTLRGLLESQTGLYSCRHVSSEKQISNSTFNTSTYFDIRVPGRHIFMDEQHKVHVKSQDQTINIWCQSSNPNLELTLWKALPHDDKVTLEPILENSLLQSVGVDEPEIIKKQQELGLFSLKNTNDSFGLYYCTAGDKNSTIEVKSWNNESAPMEDFNYLKILRLKRRSCGCNDEKDFSKLYDESPKSVLSERSCSLWRNTSGTDWKIAEFYENGEVDCLNIKTEVNPGFKGLKVNQQKKTWHNLTVLCHEESNYVNLTIIFYGYDTRLAQGFRIGVQTLRKTGGLTDIKYLDQNFFLLPSDRNDSSVKSYWNPEPDDEWTSKLGLIKFKWTMKFLNLTRIHRVHVFQPYKLTPEWKDFIASFVNDQPMSKFIYSKAKNIRNLSSQVGNHGISTLSFNSIWSRALSFHICLTSVMAGFSRLVHC